MSTFHVYVEGATDPAPNAIERLADAMAARYGLPAAELVARMSRGRFRVKANTDRATAETYVRDLVALGARAVIEEGVRASAPSLQVPNVAMTPAVGVPVVSRTMTPSPLGPPRAAGATNPPQFQSGLSAAFAPSDATTDLGALGDNATFTLASIDGRSDDAPGPVEAFGPPPDASLPEEPKVGVTFKPITKPIPKVKPADIPSEFAPPDAEDANMAVDIAPDELDYRARKSSMPPMTVAVPESASPAMRRSSPSVPPVTASPQPAMTGAGASAASSSNLLASARARLVIGVVLAIGIGFLPAHVFASMRASDGRAIDAAVIDHQQRMTTVEEFEGLDAYRAEQLDRKRSQHRNTGIAAMLIWAVVGVGLGYVWFRRVPWDRVTGAS